MKFIASKNKGVLVRRHGAAFGVRRVFAINFIVKPMYHFKSINVCGTTFRLKLGDHSTSKPMSRVLQDKSQEKAMGGEWVNIKWYNCEYGLS